MIQRQQVQFEGIEFVFWTADNGHGGFCVRDRQVEYLTGNSRVCLVTDDDVAWATRCAALGALGVRSPHAAREEVLLLLAGEKSWEKRPREEGGSAS